jgi:hypothetical protein
MKATIHGWDTPVDEFYFEQGLPVYTDGSAIHVQYPEIACSAAAAFQVDSAGKHRLLTVQNDPSGPQSAIAGEAIAVELATYGLSRSPHQRPTQLVADCQAVVNNLNALPRALGYRQKYAGHFLDTQTVQLCPHKIKSHMTEAVATQMGVRQHWFGNSKADHFANEARASTGKAGLAYIAQQKALFAQLLSITQAATGLPPVLTRPNRKAASTIREAGRQPDPHSFARQGPRWICTRCGITARSAARKAGGCSQAARVVERIHPTHRLFAAFHEEHGLTTPFYFCNRCGAHSTTRVAALHNMCLPKLVPTPAMKRLAASRHPRSNGLLLEVRRLRMQLPPAAASGLSTTSKHTAPAVTAAAEPAIDEHDYEMQAALELGLGTTLDSD